jgi:hypothetical protein
MTMKYRNKTTRGRKSPRTTLRKRVTNAVRAMARGFDPMTAYARTKMFYRSGGGAWTRALT